MAEYEHSKALREAQDALVTLRHRARKLHWISGGRGYDGMGARESEILRTKLDEAGFWLGALSRSLNAGGERAKGLGYDALGGDASGSLAVPRPGDTKKETSGLSAPMNERNPE